MKAQNYPTSTSSKSHAVPHRLKALDGLATTRTCHRGQEITGQGRAAEHWYCVLSGAARRYVIRLDGRRQIVDLLLPGDCFGFTAADEYDFTVEAVTEGTMVACYPRRRAEMLADSSPEIGRVIRQAIFEALSRLQSQLLIVGRITALEKVASFILELEQRLPHERHDSVELPLSRYDIADYLAVSVETVSRSLTDLKHRGLIRFSGMRTVEIVNRVALEDGEPPAALPPTRAPARCREAA